MSSIYKLLLLAVMAVSISSCSSDSDEEPIMEIDTSRLPMSDVPDMYFRWTIEGEEFIAESEYQGANTFGSEMIISGATGTSISGDFVFLRINNDNTDPVMQDASYPMDSESKDEITLQYPNDVDWSTTNSGGSGTCRITQFQAYHDVLFNIDYVEGTFSGTLTSLTEAGEINIENGSFGLVVRR